MATGEGKTLVAALAGVVWATTGLGVHVVTANPYLAERDANSMAPLFHALDLTVGCINATASQSPSRAMVYEASIAYASMSELVFDYLRDMMAATRNDQMQRVVPGIMLIDEADAVLLDEARTPFIISGPSGDAALVAQQVQRWTEPVRQLWEAQSKIADDLVQKISDRLLRVPEASQRRQDHELASLLWLLQHAAPKHPRLQDWKRDPVMHGLVELVSKQRSVGRRFSMLANSSVASIEEAELLVMVDDRRNGVHLTERGLAFLSEHSPDGQPLVLPDDVTMAAAMAAAALRDEGDEGASSSESSNVQDVDHFGVANIRLRMISALVRAFATVQRDVDYVVINDQVEIVDANTGRVLVGRRWSEGLHTAVEAKESVRLQPEQQTVAAMALQHYVRLAAHVAGMTGTAATDAAEFERLYDIGVTVIPRHRPLQRRDWPARIFLSADAKRAAVVAEVQRLHAKQSPILIGTASVSESERMAESLQKVGINATVLNAVQHAQEAVLIARAGEPGAVTVATNMAGRGTDIVLAAAVDRSVEGGLWVISTELHESRRVDAQLRGRAGRQGDPGTTQVFVSAEDNLLRRWGAERLPRLLQSLGGHPTTGELAPSPRLSTFLESIQHRVEVEATAGRTRMLKFDDVLDQQRHIVMGLRQRLLGGGDLTEGALTILGEQWTLALVQAGAPLTKKKGNARNAQWRQKLSERIGSLASVELASDVLACDGGLATVNEMKERVQHIVNHAQSAQWNDLENLTKIGGLNGVSRLLVAGLVVSKIDQAWQQHLQHLDELQSTIEFRSVGQKDPVIEYATDAWAAFTVMWNPLAEELVSAFLRLRLSIRPPVEESARPEVTPGQKGNAETGV